MHTGTYSSSPPLQTTGLGVQAMPTSSEPYGVIPLMALIMNSLEVHDGTHQSHREGRRALRLAER